MGRPTAGGTAFSGAPHSGYGGVAHPGMGHAHHSPAMGHAHHSSAYSGMPGASYPGPGGPPYPAHGAAPHAALGVAHFFGGGAAPPSGRGNKLVVRVKSATGLRNTDGPFAGKSDPYVVLRIVDQRGWTVAGPKETSVKKDTLEPVWNEDIVFDGLDRPSSYTLKANIFDKDTFLGTGYLDWLSKDDALGSGSIDLGTLYRRTDFQDVQLVVERRKFGLFKAKINIGLSTLGGWGNGY